MKKHLLIVCMLIVVLFNSSCSLGEADINNIISAMRTSEKTAPVGKIYLSTAKIGEDEYISESLLTAFFGEVKADDVLKLADSFAFRISLVKSPYEYAVVKSKTVDDTDEIAKMLTLRIDAARAHTNRGEDEAEKAIANSAEIYIRGKYVFLLMTDNNQEILAAAKKVIN